MDANKIEIKQAEPNLLYKVEVFRIVGAAMEVHNQLGCGFLEGVYQEALELEFTSQGIPFTPQQELEVLYKGKPLRKRFISDFVAYQKIVVEIKAINSLTSADKAQVINYLKATHCEVGVLINFGAQKLEWYRFVQTH
jgi:GxxExxY protein